MIGASVLYLIGISAVLGVAAWGVGEGLRRVGLPARWVWLAAMSAGPALLLAPLVAPGGEVAVPAVAAVVELTPLIVGALEGFSPAWDVVIAGAWLLLSLGMAATIVWMRRGLERERGRWPREPVLGREVYVSPDRGPAVAGVLRPWIVLPRWVLSLPEVDLGLVVLHEEEHLRARDSLLLATALVFVIATPWNPVSWWMLRRLRIAMEMDCDRRVLRRAPDRERYGQSLLSVACRVNGQALGLAAFAERPQSLERRIIAMTESRTRWTPFRAGFLVLFGAVVATQACAVDSPVGSPDVAVQESTQATVTPFTVAPSILNRSEVVTAMEQEYPPLLRDAGIGGTVGIQMFITEEGDVSVVRIDESSGHPAFDDAALRVGRTFRFSAALDGDDPVGVWVNFPITFQVN